MIGYRRGYTLQELEALSLPSVETSEATDMSPAVSDGDNRIFYFNREGDKVTLCDKLGRQEDGYGMTSTTLKYGLDYALFEDGTSIGRSRIENIDLANGVVTFKDPVIEGDKVRAKKTIALDYVESTLPEEITLAVKARAEVDLIYVTRAGVDKPATKAIADYPSVNYIDYVAAAVPASGLLSGNFNINGGFNQPQQFVIKAEDEGVKNNGISFTLKEGERLSNIISSWNLNNPDKQVLIYDQLGNGGTIEELIEARGGDFTLSTGASAVSTTLAGGTEGENILESISFNASALDVGQGGNNIQLNCKGNTTLAQEVSSWNSSYPSNTIDPTSIRINGAWYGSSSILTAIWNSKNIEAGTIIRFTGGADLEVEVENEVTDTVPVVFEADAYGPSGNNIKLVFDEDNPRTIQQVIDDDAYGEVTVITSDSVKALTKWKSATVKLSGGAGESVIEERDVINSAVVGFEADAYGAQGDQIVLAFDGIEEVPNVVSAWNIANPDNTVSLTLLPDIFDPTEIGYKVPSPAVVELEGGTNEEGISSSVPANGSKMTCNYYKRASEISSIGYNGKSGTTDGADSTHLALITGTALSEFAVGDLIRIAKDGDEQVHHVTGIVSNPSLTNISVQYHSENVVKYNGTGTPASAGLSTGELIVLLFSSFLYTSITQFEDADGTANPNGDYIRMTDSPEVFSATESGLLSQFEGLQVAGPIASSFIGERVDFSGYLAIMSSPTTPPPIPYSVSMSPKRQAGSTFLNI